ncbi:MAG: cation:proton antiporter [Gammaproteobacteria bacterium]
MVALWVACAFTLGLICRAVGLPSLIGFLATGFALNAVGVEKGPALDDIAHMGVLLLLFTVGLKLRIQNMARPEVWGTAIAHMAVSVGLFAPALYFGMGLDWRTAFVVGAALSFSSTVLAAKVLEEKRELRAFHGRIAIGILIVQDLVAVGLLAAQGGHAPSPFAILLLALPLMRPALHWLLDFSGHGEMLVLFGALLALAAGGLGFEALGLSAELGALVLGTLLAEHPRANELSKALWGLKEFFLVGFFLSIGFAGLPTLGSFGFAIAMVLALVVKLVLFFGILLAFKLRARTSFLCSLSLAAYSEFGLIVAGLSAHQGLIDEQWLVYIALSVALSFLVSAPLNNATHRLYERWGPRLDRFQSARRHPDDSVVNLGHAEIVVVGMGRVGTGAYDFLRHQGKRVVGLDSDPAKLQRHLQVGRRVVFADAEDPGFWLRLNLDSVHAVLLAVPDLEAKIIAISRLRRRGYEGFISATHVFPEEREPVLETGANATYNYFDEAGVGFAEHCVEELDQRAGPEQAVRQA